MIVFRACRDVRTLYVKFAAPIKDAFDKLAGKLGWKPEQLGEKIVLDFMETVTRESFRPESAEKALFDTEDGP